MHFFFPSRIFFRLSLCACDEKKSKSSFLPLVVLHFFQRERRARRAFDNFHTRINASRRAESSRSRAHGASSVRAFLKERRESSFFREKRKTDEPNYCKKFDRAREGKKRERERETPRVNSPPLEKAPREREEEEDDDEERIALVDTQKQR